MRKIFEQQNLTYDKFLDYDNDNNFGLARSFLAVSSLLTLIFNDIQTLFVNVAGTKLVLSCTGINKISIFCLLGVENLIVSKYICIGILLLVITGVYPRITSILHWWISFSIFNSMKVIDGGDQIINNLCLFIIPIFLVDNRKNHWIKSALLFNENTKYVVYFSLLLIRIQICFLYFQAAIEKMKVTEWKDGTAIYYWLNHRIFGLPDMIKPAVNFILSYPFVVVFFTWGTIILELFLASGIFIDKKYRSNLFKMGVIFHVLIAISMGIPSFSLAMVGALLLYLKPFKIINNEYYI
jgi:antimicrobial peptide system SdpB family protein